MVKKILELPPFIILRHIKCIYLESIQSKDSRPIVIYMTACIIYMIIETVYSNLSNSMSLISNALHMLCDSLALFSGLAAVYIRKNKYLHNKYIKLGSLTITNENIESVSALANCVFLILTATYLFIESLSRLYPLKIN